MVDEAVLTRVRASMRTLKPPGHYDKVYKEECMYSFDSPESPGGVYVNLTTYQGFGEDYVKIDHEKTGNVLYLHQKWTRVPVPKDPNAPPVPEKLAVGGPGGFNVNGPQFTLDKQHWFVLMPEQTRVQLPCPDLPEYVIQTLDAVIKHESASAQEAAAVWEEERKVSKYAENLPQLDTGRKISPNPKDWKCDETGVTGNLWLNLSTGFIGSGRQNWDGTGGNGSALRHYEQTGSKYPLVVKLGTIMPHGADVYSYAPDEDDMVTDPWLPQHLAHWGIDVMKMEKTEKTMAEMQVELNISYEFSRITEAGSALTPLHGPGATGLINLGNSCYMNSVLQVLFTLPEFQQRYATPEAAARIFGSAPQDAPHDLPSQLAKVGVALVNGRTGHVGKPPVAPQQQQQVQNMEVDGQPAGGGEGDELPADERVVAVRPARFKALVGQGHPEFSTARQQDAGEFLAHLLEMIARTEHGQAARLGVGAPDSPSTAPLAALFKFLVEDRVQCCESGAVAYRRNAASSLMLQVPVEAATNKEAVEAYKEREAKRRALKESSAAAYIGGGTGGDGAGGAAGGADGVVMAEETEDPVVPTVPLAACLAKFAAAEVIDDYRSAALGGKRVAATKRTGLSSFPPYLVLQVQRYYQDTDWSYKKLEVLVDVPDTLDLEGLRSSGPQPGEQLQPEDDTQASSGQQQQQQQQQAAQQAAQPAGPDAELVANLESMGFGANACKRAALAVSNAGVEAAMEWLLGHLEDSDINDPLPEHGSGAGAGAAAAAPAAAADPEKVSMLTAMGFSDQQAAAALTACGGSVERAGDWLFSHMDDLDSAVAQVMSSASAAPQTGAAGGGAATGAPTSSSSSAAVLDGPGRYELVGFVSHLGANLGCGHYVCHIKKDGRWIIFNDEKVALSEAPPCDLGYLYFFKRTTA